MNDSYSQFEKEALALVSNFPSFIFSKNGEGVPQLAGTLFLNDEQGQQIDSYEIRIVCPDDYPLSFPYVYETNGRIPVNVDWHVYADGHACICSVPEEIIACSNGITLEWFFHQQIIPYFFNQKHREMHGYFLNERVHGIEGNQAYFRDLFKTNNLNEISNLIRYIVNNVEPNRVSDCFCGSGNKYRRCHRNAFRIFKPLPVKIVAQLLLYIENA
ncbi:SEC-C metal-binding domain-containing protein [Mucilaginibacter pedocola]|uniref:SEC-C domain-containing protein n=1 Tax=Mucilaginibacter pedocola TaxID=1792845 RepID=A0A1S9P8Y5_9SPHI|nr:SEC-C metal-binding domain-containing protein [Mucilaginibacter pedocola]OOQ57412.1 hypothetical protein BC343_15045 [Mucilaginibacter pedocola]